jgi:hypothetical protein
MKLVTPVLKIGNEISYTAFSHNKTPYLCVDMVKRFFCFGEGPIQVTVSTEPIAGGKKFQIRAIPEGSTSWAWEWNDRREDEYADKWRPLYYDAARDFFAEFPKGQVIDVWVIVQQR